MFRSVVRGFFLAKGEMSWRESMLQDRTSLARPLANVYLDRVTDLPPECECLMLFDGVCHLCEGTVRLVLAHDKHARIHFAPIQSELGRRLYAGHGRCADAPDTVLLVTREGVFSHSDAVIEIARRLGGVWKLAVLGRLIPRALRDAAYKYVAMNRYRWFGRDDRCLIPKPEWSTRMLS